jgi:hypothetical protein
MTLQLLHSEFPYISGKFYFFFISAPVQPPRTRLDDGRLQSRTSHLVKNLEDDVRLDDLPLCILQLEVVALDEAV